MERTQRLTSNRYISLRKEEHDNMNNKRFVEEATKMLASAQPEFIHKGKLLNELKIKLEGLDRAKHYSRYRAIQECIALVQDFRPE